MSNKIKVLPDMIPDVKFNTIAQEQFTRDKGVVFEHYAAIPSPIGLKDRGDYRRSGSLDTVSENGFIYRKVGEFLGTIVSNSLSQNQIDGGIFDNSTARMVLPKYYNDKCPSKTEEISLLPGDRIYAKGIELRVANYQRAEFSVKHNDFLQFPAKCVSHLMDSRGIEYKYGTDFKIDKDGNIKWIVGKENPGVDETTGKGRTYSIRYTFLAYWYISALINEIRVTNDGDGNPVRLPYQVQIQREYVYHNRNKGDSKEITSEAQKPTSRTNEEPAESLDPNKYDVQVDISQFEE